MHAAIDVVFVQHMLHACGHTSSTMEAAGDDVSLRAGQRWRNRRPGCSHLGLQHTDLPRTFVTGFHYCIHILIKLTVNISWRTVTAHHCSTASATTQLGSIFPNHLCIVARLHCKMVNPSVVSVFYFTVPGFNSSVQFR